MTIRIYTLTSALHDVARIEEQSRCFLAQIQADTPYQLELAGDNMQTFAADDLPVLFVRTGGTEAIYLHNINYFAGRTIYLLTSGKNNSLAASAEILAHIRQQGGRGEILHGTTEYIARRLTVLAQAKQARLRLSGQHIGVIGEPSDWLIAGQVDEQTLRDQLNISISRIPMAELLDILYTNPPIDPETRKRLRHSDSAYFDGALRIYQAIRILINRHRLTAVTLRCFDLLYAVRNTGCLALALLNQEGIPASCEGDIPTLLTMMVANALSGQSGFQANPARINPETDELLFAHCTVPLNMITDYQYDTHFESGIGVAIHGELPTGDITLLKISGDLKRLFAHEGQLLRNQCEQDLCRTQVVLRIPHAAHYFLTDPIANHHVILPGKWRSAVEELTGIASL